MRIRKLILGGAVAAALAAFAQPADARTNVDLFVRFGPPPVYDEAVPAPRAGWVWVPGYWDWRTHRHHWVAGHWVRSRAGYVYAAPRWVSYRDGWRFERGGYRRWDMDRDGIANHRDRDRDGDGVPNRWDRAPNNPWYR